MMAKVYRSRCCNAEVKTNGMPDFLGSEEACTFNYICLKCDKPCDAVTPKSQGQKTREPEKPVIIELSVNDDIYIRLTKEGRKIYREYRKKYRHDPLKKTNSRWMSVPLWEFMHIFGSRMFMGATNVIVGNIIRIAKF